jgi:hypothetical protein
MAHFPADRTEKGLMSGHQVDQSGRIKAAQRHVATLALLNGVSCVVFGGVAAWLFTGVPFAVDQDEARARICLGAFSAIACVLNAVLAMGLRRCNRVARVGLSGALTRFGVSGTGKDALSSFMKTALSRNASGSLTPQLRCPPSRSAWRS